MPLKSYFFLTYFPIYFPIYFQTYFPNLFPTYFQIIIQLGNFPSSPSHPSLRIHMHPYSSPLGLITQAPARVARPIPGEPLGFQHCTWCRVRRRASSRSSYSRRRRLDAPDLGPTAWRSRRRAPVRRGRRGRPTRAWRASPCARAPRWRACRGNDVERTPRSCGLFGLGSRGGGVRVKRTKRRWR